MPKISLQDRGDPGAIIKGPATDASMITQMKRRAAVTAQITAYPQGRKGTGAIVDGPLTRGFTDTSIRSTYLKHGGALGFFRVL